MKIGFSFFLSGLVQTLIQILQEYWVLRRVLASTNIFSKFKSLLQFSRNVFVTCNCFVAACKSKSLDWSNLLVKLISKRMLCHIIKETIKLKFEIFLASLLASIRDKLPDDPVKVSSKISIRALCILSNWYRSGFNASIRLSHLVSLNGFSVRFDTLRNKTVEHYVEEGKYTYALYQIKKRRDIQTTLSSIICNKI